MPGVSKADLQNLDLHYHDYINLVFCNDYHLTGFVVFFDDLAVSGPSSPVRPNELYPFQRLRPASWS